MTLSPGPDSLSEISLAVGAVFLFLGVFGLTRTDRFRAMLLALPRAVWFGRIVLLVGMVWAALWSPLLIGEFLPSMTDKIFPLLQVFWIAAYFAVVFFLGDLLACRAMGLLLVLLPSIMLSAARWHPSPARYLVIVLAYVFAVLGMFYIARPWMFRDHLAFLEGGENRPKIAAVVSLVLAALLMGSAVLCF